MTHERTYTRTIRFLLLLFLLAVHSNVVGACTTFVVGPDATSDGSVLSSHSNDGDGDTAGNVVKVSQETWAKNMTRKVSNGFLPQISQTYGYITKVGGYASVNQRQVGLAESTCVSVLAGNKSRAILNIVDLSELCLERSKTAIECIKVMGSLAEKYGYYDAGESLLVSDPRTAYIFHITPDDTGASAVWVAQRVPSNHVAVVANMFVIRDINFTDSENFVFSSNLVSVASRATNWTTEKPLDFTLYFSGAEGRKYVSGRRMWRALELLTNTSFPSTYGDFVKDAPYPTTAKSRIKISVRDMREIMRDYYNNTAYSLSAPGTISGGPFGSPDRSTPGNNEKTLGIYFERTISTHRTIVSYVLRFSRWLSDDVGSEIWIGFHAAHTSLYIPFVAGIDRMPSTHTNNSLSSVDRYHGAFNAARFVYNIAQIHFDLAILDIREMQQRIENRSELLLRQLQQDFVRGNATAAYVANTLRANAERCVREWWNLSDQLVLRYADGYCNGCGRGPRHLGYPSWWLRRVA